MIHDPTLPSTGSPSMHGKTLGRATHGLDTTEDDVVVVLTYI